MPSPRYHNTIFVETSLVDLSSRMHHVTGDITASQGMMYASRSSDRPENSRTFFDKEFLGYTLASTYPASFDNVLQNVTPPPQQKAFNVASMRTEPFKSLNPLTFYAPGETRRPLM